MHKMPAINQFKNEGIEKMKTILVNQPVRVLEGHYARLVGNVEVVHDDGTAQVAIKGVRDGEEFDVVEIFAIDNLEIVK